MNLNRTRPWVAAGVILAIAMAVATWLLAVAPTRSEAAALRDDTASVQTQNDVLMARATTLEQQAEDRAGLEARARGALAALPDDINLPAFNRQLAQHAQARGIEIVSISAGAAAAPGGTATEASSADLLAVPITIETSGPRLAQMYFLRDVQEDGPRAALVTSTSVTADGDDLLTAPIQIQTTMTTQLSVFSHALTARDDELLADVVDSSTTAG